MKNKVTNWLKNEIVLVISFFAAAISCIFVKPNTDYLNYIDYRTLALLYALMVVVVGLQKARVFHSLAHWLCSKADNVRLLALSLIVLTFFGAMLITNDVALITFVPFSIIVFELANKNNYLCWTVVLQIVAANLGSMLTPVGNPQNLYIFSKYDMPITEFIKITAPTWGCSLVIICILVLTIGKEKTEIQLGEKPGVEKKETIMYLILFLVCLFVVFRLINWYVMLGIVVLVCFMFEPKVLIKADFGLLGTFLCFFVFSGNLAKIETIQKCMFELLINREILVSALLSQVISNVPTTLLLSSFTNNSQGLLIGVNIGGLGTPIASLASLIGMKLYLASEEAALKKFMSYFLILNVVLLFILLIFAEITI